jgi:hypothetical protein
MGRNFKGLKGLHEDPEGIIWFKADVRGVYPSYSTVGQVLFPKQLLRLWNV